MSRVSSHSCFLCKLLPAHLSDFQKQKTNMAMAMDEDLYDCSLWAGNSDALNGLPVVGVDDSSSQASSRASKAKRGNPPKVCGLEGCSDQCKQGQRWCYYHFRLFDNMRCRARKQGPDFFRSWTETMKNTSVANLEIRKFATENISHTAFKHKSPIDWVPGDNTHSLSF